MLEERNVGDWLHSLVQSNILFALRRRYPFFKVVAGLRSRTTVTRFRLPDVSVLVEVPHTKFQLEAAFVAIEVLSEDDRMTKVMEKLAEYAANGIPNIWVVDPRLRAISVYKAGALVQVKGDCVVATGIEGVIEIARAEIFAD